MKSDNNGLVEQSEKNQSVDENFNTDAQHRDVDRHYPLSRAGFLDRSGLPEDREHIFSTSVNTMSSHSSNKAE
jgi:hypothetical protein